MSTKKKFEELIPTKKQLEVYRKNKKVKYTFLDTFCVMDETDCDDNVCGEMYDAKELISKINLNIQNNINKMLEDMTSKYMDSIVDRNAEIKFMLRRAYSDLNVNAYLTYFESYHEYVNRIKTEREEKLLEKTENKKNAINEILGALQKYNISTEELKQHSAKNKKLMGLLK